MRNPAGKILFIVLAAWHLVWAFGTASAFGVAPVGFIGVSSVLPILIGAGFVLEFHRRKR